MFKKSSMEWIHIPGRREPAGKLEAGSDPKLLKSTMQSIECLLLILQWSDVKKRYCPGEKKKSFLEANRLGSVCSSCEEQEAAYQQTKISLHLSLELMNFSFFSLWWNRCPIHHIWNILFHPRRSGLLTLGHSPAGAVPVSSGALGLWVRRDSWVQGQQECSRGSWNKVGLKFPIC